MMNDSALFNTLQLLQAYERAIDENIISSITDTSGIIVHANTRFCAVSQFSVAEILGRSHQIVNSGYHPKSFFAGMWRTIKNGEVWHGEIRNKAKDGSFYWVDTVVVPVKDDNGANTHYLSLRTLVTERKMIEASRARYLGSLEALLVMTSNNVRIPLAECLRQLDKYDPESDRSKTELRQLMINLKTSAKALDGFTRELTDFITEMER